MTVHLLNQFHLLAALNLYALGNLGPAANAHAGKGRGK